MGGRWWDRVWARRSAPWIWTQGRWKQASINARVLALCVAFAVYDTLFGAISWIAVALLAIGVVPFLAPLVESVSLPGGVALAMRETRMARREAGEVKEELQAVGLTTLEVSRSQGDREPLTDVRSYPPELALAGARIELERVLNDALTNVGLVELAERTTQSKSQQPKSQWSLVAIDALKRRIQGHDDWWGVPTRVKIEYLTEFGFLRADEVAPLTKLLNLLTRAVHAEPIGDELRDWAIETSAPLLNVLRMRIASLSSPTSQRPTESVPQDELDIIAANKPLDGPALSS